MNQHTIRHDKSRPKAPKPAAVEKRMAVRPAKDAHAPLGINERHGDRRLFVDFGRALEDGLRLLGAAPGTLDRIRDAEQGQPAAQHYGPSGRRAVLWCAVHESDHCTELDTAGEAIPCSTLFSHQMRPDAVGEAAISPDQARADEKTLTEAMRAVCTEVEKAMVVAAAHSARQARLAQRREAEEENRRWCENCARIDNPVTKQPRKEWPRGQSKTDVGGRLEHAAYLCEWCAKIVVRTAELYGAGRVPTLEELHRHHDEGKRIMLPVPGAISAAPTRPPAA